MKCESDAADMAPAGWRALYTGVIDGECICHGVCKVHTGLPPSLTIPPSSPFGGVYYLPYFAVHVPK